MKTPNANYWLDVLIGIAFVASGMTGLVFLLPTGPGATFLGLAYALWSDLHTWSSLALIAGVGAHLVLHWKWISYMTRRRLGVAKPAMVRQPVPAGSVSVSSMAVLSPTTPQTGLLSRRSFLALGGGMAVWSGLVIVGLGTLARSLRHAEVSDVAATETGAVASATQTALPEATVIPLQAVATAQPERQVLESLTGVACRHGVVNDPYPGRCHSYVDRDGDGICDLSVPGSGSQPVRRNG